MTLVDQSFRITRISKVRIPLIRQSLRIQHLCRFECGWLWKILGVAKCCPEGASSPYSKVHRLILCFITTPPACKLSLWRRTTYDYRHIVGNGAETLARVMIYLCMKPPSNVDSGVVRPSTAFPLFFSPQLLFLLSLPLGLTD